MENKNKSLVKGLTVVFSVLGCLIFASTLYTIFVDGGCPIRKDILTPWWIATLVDFNINAVALAAWISYKESNWISAALWVIMLALLGSTTMCPYILLQFFKLSPQEVSQDPMYHVLLRRQNKDVMEQRRKHSPVAIARIIFSALALLMLGTMVYALLTDGSPFRREVYFLWVTVTILDIYIIVVALSVWVTYKESSWISAFFWIILLICFRSITTCAYIVKQFSLLTSQEPLYLVLLKSENRIEAGEKPKRAPSDRLKGA